MPEKPFPGETDPPAPTSARLRWARRLGWVALAVLALFGPWPVDNATYRGSAYEARTLVRLAELPGPPAPGPIRVGIAEVDLTPDAPVSLAGFSTQAGKPFAAIDTRCFARALSIGSASRTTTIVTADLLLVNAEMARLVAARAGVPLKDLYFTSSHTHGGPGGWGRHPLERLVAGRFDPAVLRFLGERIGDAVRRSRANLVAAEVAMVQAHPPGRQKNRVVPGGPTHDALSALVFRPQGADDGARPLAILTVFGAHATIVRADPPRLSADYPGALVAALQEKTGAGMVLFAAGAVGDAAPIRPEIASTPKAAKIVGERLADDLLVALPSARFSDNVVVDHLRLAVDLPPMRLSFFSPWLRFSPAATWWIADQTTHLDALRIGPATLLGFPGDEAGHLAQRVVDEAQPFQPTPVVTSFNGDYRGYFESGPIYFDRSCYETRWMNFYGPWLGEYLGEIGGQMARKLAGNRPSVAPTWPFPGKLVRPVALVLLILMGLGVRRPGLNPGRWSRLGWVVGLGTVVAFLVAPGSVDWAKFAVLDPMTAIMAGSWVGCWSAWQSWRRRLHRETALAAGLLALGLVTGLWPVFLALAVIRMSGAHQS